MKPRHEPQLTERSPLEGRDPAAGPTSRAVGDSAPSAPARPIGKEGIRGRVIILLAVFVPAVVLFNVWGNLVSGRVSAPDSLLGLAVGGLAVLQVANAALRRLRPRWMLSRGELLTVYVGLIIAVGMTVTVWDSGGSVASMITWPIWNADANNQWEQAVWPSLSKWLVVTDRQALAGFYLGGESPYAFRTLAAWATPALWWTGWTVATLWVSLCLCVIVRRRWSQEEQLPFPMTVLPLQMTDPRGEVLTNRLWWVGVAVAVAFSAWNTLPQFLPAFPAIPTGINLFDFVGSGSPWDALRDPGLGWDFWYIGLSYLMPLDLAFSMIVFNIGWRAEYVVSRLLGWTVSSWSGFPHGDQQSIGAYLALLGTVLWLDRRYLLQVLRKALGMSSPADDTDEALSYRTAVFGAIGGAAFTWYFLARAGMSAGVVAILITLYFAMLMVMARMRAQLGPPNHEMLGAMPRYVLTEFPGTRAVGPRGLGLLALLGPYMGGQRATAAPAQLEGLRLAERARIAPRQLVLVMVGVSAATMLCYFLASLHVGYHVGLGTAKTDESATWIARNGMASLETWLQTPAGPNWSGVGAVGVGAGITALLMALKLQFSAWPLHPLAFPLALSQPVDEMLPSILIAYLTKLLLLRYGGLRAHRRALPFFLGLLVGGAVAKSLQLVVARVIGSR